jgi:hypothetical protein
MDDSLFDPETGEIRLPEGEHDAADHECIGCRQRDSVIEAMGTDLILVEKALRNERRKVKVLEAELKQQRQEAPEAQMVKALYKLWVDLTNRDKKRTKLGEKREKAVLKALRMGYAYEDLADAIRGGSRFAYTNPEGKRFDDLELILRDEVKIERFRDAWRQENPPEGQLLPV